MNHKEMQYLVSSFIDGEVNENEKAQVLLHLEGCPACRLFTDHAKLMRNEICSLGEAALSDSFPARVVHAVEIRDEQTIEWLGIEPSARNTFILLAGFVLVVFFLTRFDNNTAAAMSDQLFYKNTPDSAATKVLLQQERLTKNDLLYAVMTK